MKYMMCLFLCALIWMGCDTRSSELEQQNAELRQQTEELRQDLAAREEYVDNVAASISQIYESLEVARAREKAILREKGEMEATRKLTRAEIRETLLNRISLIDSTLKENRERIVELQSQLKSSRSQYAGLNKMVMSLKKTVEEREQSIAELEQKVRGLEQEVTTKAMMISERDSLIDQQNSLINTQRSQLTTGYYVVGTRGELEKRGIIRKEGGFLWGLLGAITVLESGFDEQHFLPIDKNEGKAIRVSGEIEELVPKRNEQFYTKTKNGNKESVLTIGNPDLFWQEKYLVIITD